jgi:hypothetical protein
MHRVHLYVYVDRIQRAHPRQLLGEFGIQRPQVTPAVYMPVPARTRALATACQPGLVPFVAARNHLGPCALEPLRAPPAFPFAFPLALKQLLQTHGAGLVSATQ